MSKLRLNALASAMLIAGPMPIALAGGRDVAVEFDPAMLGAANRDVDLARFAYGNPVDPGTHDVELMVNGIAVARRNVRFATPEGRQQVEACVDAALLSVAGVRDEVVAAADMTTRACTPIDLAITGATAQYDTGDLRLSLTIPQADLDFMARGETDPATWDAGETGARLNYAINAYHADVAFGDAYRNASANLDAGMNIGAWRFRHRSMHHWSNAGRTSQVLSAYAQTDVIAHRAQATFGDFQTSGALFDSFTLRGVEFESDDRMWPDSLRGYAPEVRGIAHGNAVVSVRQNGALLHEVNVPAGPFVIRDLYPTGYGGELEVTVTEADGRKDVFVVPYSAVPQLLRPGQSRFSIAVGEWRGYDTDEKPVVIQATAQRGFTNLITGYTGFQASDDYAAIIAGTALNTRIGAFAIDAINAWAQPAQRGESGQSWRASYSQFLPNTSTSIMVAAHRHSTRDYWSLADQIAFRAQGPDWSTTLVPARSRNRFELQLSQPVGRGALHASASMRDFWDGSAPERNAQLSYDFRIGPASLGLTHRWRENAFGRNNETYASFTLPLGARGAHRVTTNAGRADDRGTFGMASLTGSGGPGQRVSYGLTSSRDGDDLPVRTSANVGYEGSKGRATLMGSHASGLSQWSGSVDGGVLWHRGGVTFGPTMTDTIGLIHAPHASGARIPNAAGVRVDRDGYAIVPSLAPYRVNLVDVDPLGIAPDVHFQSTLLRVVPRAGAIVRLGFDSKREASWVLRALREDGLGAPFGAEVRDALGTMLGIVGQGGAAFLSGTPAAGPLRIQWGDAAHERCEVSDGRPQATAATAVQLPQVEASCVTRPQEG